MSEEGTAAPPEPRIGRSLLAGAACVILYSVAGALVASMQVSRGVTPGSDPQSDLLRLALAGGFVLELLQGPVLWIIGSGLFACGLWQLKRPRSFRLVLAVTGVAFLPLAVWAAIACGVVLGHGDLPAWVTGMWFRACLLVVAGGMVVARSKKMMQVEVLHSAAALVFAAGLFLLGKWLPAYLARSR